jgi:hypothetical protein
MGMAKIPTDLIIEKLPYLLSDTCDDDFRLIGGYIEFTYHCPKKGQSESVRITHLSMSVRVICFFGESYTNVIVEYTPTTFDITLLKRKIDTKESEATVFATKRVNELLDKEYPPEKRPVDAVYFTKQILEGMGIEIIPPLAK